MPEQCLYVFQSQIMHQNHSYIDMPGHFRCMIIKIYMHKSALNVADDIGLLKANPKNQLDA